MHTNDKELLDLVKKVTGEKLTRVEVHLFKPMRMISYWSGGYRDYWYLVKYPEGKALELPQSGSGFEQGSLANGVMISELPLGFILIRLTFSGMHKYAAIYGELAKMLPEPKVDLTKEERIVLEVAKRYTSHHRRESARHAGVNTSNYNNALLTLQQKGLLNKRNAITIAGRNLVESLPRISLY